MQGQVGILTPENQQKGEKRRKPFSAREIKSSIKQNLSLLTEVNVSRKSGNRRKGLTLRQLAETAERQR